MRELINRLSLSNAVWVLGALGGNQRDQDRLKAQKKADAKAKKPKESATNLAKRKEA